MQSVKVSGRVSKDWSFWKQPLVELSGKTMGIVGYGRIGHKVAEIAQAFGMNVMVTGTKRPENLGPSDCVGFTGRTICGSRRGIAPLPTYGLHERVGECRASVPDETQCFPDQYVARRFDRRAGFGHSFEFGPAGRRRSRCTQHRTSHRTFPLDRRKKLHCYSAYCVGYAGIAFPAARYRDIQFGCLAERASNERRLLDEINR